MNGGGNGNGNGNGVIVAPRVYPKSNVNVLQIPSSVSVARMVCGDGVYHLHLDLFFTTHRAAI